MMGHFVLEELLEKKLGIRPVILTEGRKKDWPSSFRAPSEEELQYLREKVLSPAYERFVDVIAEGRSGLLTLEEVRQLADGGIVGAREAVDKKLIDKIGYLDEAIELTKSLAGIERSRVVEYHRVFSLRSILSSKSADLLRLDRSKLYELGTPQILYLWSAYW
jgi:protease-4